MTPVPSREQTFGDPFPQGWSGSPFLEGNGCLEGFCALFPSGQEAVPPRWHTQPDGAPQPQTICTLERAKRFTQGPLSASTTAECWELPRNLQAGTLCLRGQGTRLRACVSEKQLCCDTSDGASAV